MKRLIFSLIAAVQTGTPLNDANLQIAVRVVNLEVIPDAIRLDGERMAAGILKSAGVSVAWVECDGREPNPCRTPLRRNEFWLHLLAGKPPRSLDGSAGFAVIYPTASGKDGYAGVFYRKVRAAAASEECSPATMLGATLAHEIGHLLLGSKQHSTRGVMRPRLGRADLELAARNELRFTAEQVDCIHRARGCDNSLTNAQYQDRNHPRTGYRCAWDSRPVSGRRC